MPNAGKQFAAAMFLALPACLSAADVSGGQPVTFAKDIAPILQAKCQNCHRAGQMAPMSLVSYEEVRPWAKAIKQRVLTRQMPPWHVDPTIGIQKFANDLSLSDMQIAAIAKWVDDGAPLGNVADMPPPKQWPNDGGWKLSTQFGQPDFVIKSDPYTMAAKGQDVWFKPLTAIPVTEPRWVRAVEIRPGTAAGRKITHHALAFLQQEEPGSNTGVVTQGLLMEWAVNKNYDVYRENTGKLLVPGARVWWEMHYHAVGEEIRDDVELAIAYQSDQPTLSNVHVNVIIHGPLDEQLCQLSSGPQRGDFERIPGCGAFVCRIPRLPFEAGAYRITVYSTVNADVADWVMHAAVMEVEPGDFFGTGRMNDEGQGHFLVTHNWDVQA